MTGRVYSRPCPGRAEQQAPAGHRGPAGEGLVALAQLASPGDSRRRRQPPPAAPDRSGGARMSGTCKYRYKIFSTVDDNFPKGQVKHSPPEQAF